MAREKSLRVRLSEVELAILDRMAARLGLSRSALVRYTLAFFSKELDGGQRKDDSE